MHPSKTIFSARLLIICALTIWSLCIASVRSSTTSSNGTVREWLSELNDQATTLQVSASKLQKAIAILSLANNTSSIVTMRNAQLKKITQALDLINQEIAIFKIICSNNAGPDCSTPACVSKCLNCSSSGICSVCSGNYDGIDCSVCKTGWSDYSTNCTIAVCDSKCLNCIAPGQCSSCSGNFDGSTCSTCKSGWNGSNCTLPVCDSKCITCASPGNCTTCSGNWTGSTCSIPVCDSKCLNCATGGNCSVCLGNWIGPSCSSCKTGWAGSNCTSPVCDSKCLNCTGSNQCVTCYGNWNGTTCSTCKTGWTGSNCTVPVCSDRCTTCSSPGVCGVCSGNWNGAKCTACKIGYFGVNCDSTVPGDFINSVILTNSNHRSRFMSEIMIDSAQTSVAGPQLLFRGSRDGFAASTFHTKCDDKGATIVLVKSASGAIFGGYTSVSWNQVGGYSIDPSAFIFSLISSTGGERFTKLTQENGFIYKLGSTNYPNSIYRGGYPPVFGGFDLYIAENCNANSDSSSSLCRTYCDTTMDFNTAQAQSYLAGSATFRVVDYEVYTF